MNIQAVIFDWAGTTIDFGCCAPVAAFTQAFAQFGISVTTSQVRRFMGAAKRDHISSMLNLPEIAQAWKDKMGHDVVESDIDLIYTEFMKAQFPVLHHHARLLDGVVETVSTLRKAGCHIGSNTGYTRAMMEIVVPLAKKQGYEPDLLLCADDGYPGRPAPEMIRVMADRFGVKDFKRIVKVDDAPIGIKEGIHAGTWAIGVARTGNEVGLNEKELLALPEIEQNQLIKKASDKLYEAGAHKVIHSMSELIPAIQSLVSP